MILLKPHADKIILWGMSCVGKTTFAKQLVEHQYYCFDAIFHWHSIETLGLSIESNLSSIQNQATAEKFVIDGWHLSDREGRFFPQDAVAYVIYAPYEKIISQYRIPVENFNEHYHMFEKWYKNISLNREIRYFLNTGVFIEQKEFNC